MFSVVVMVVVLVSWSLDFERDRWGFEVETNKHRGQPDRPRAAS